MGVPSLLLSFSDRLSGDDEASSQEQFLWKTDIPGVSLRNVVVG